MSTAITAGLPPFVAPMTSAPVCTITGSIHNADGSPLVYGVVQFNSVIIQVVNSVVINPTVVSTVTDSAGNLSAVSLPQGLNVQVTICPSGNGRGTPSRASAAFTVWIPFAATADFGTLTQGVALTTSGSLSTLTVSNAINVSNTSGASQITFGPTTTNVWGSVTSSTTNELALASGAYRTATGWVASAANPTVLDLNNGQFSFDANTGLTVGNTFTPTPLITIDPTGGMHMVGVPGLEVVSGGTGTKTAPTVAQILIAQSTTAYAPVTLSGDATLSAAGVLTVSHVNGATPVTSFQGRTGAVSLLLSDVTGVGGAPLASPAFSGNPTAPTPAPGDNDTSIATTAFVHAAVVGGSFLPLSGGTLTGPVTFWDGGYWGGGGIVGITGIQTAANSFIYVDGTTGSDIEVQSSNSPVNTQILNKNGLYNLVALGVGAGTPAPASGINIAGGGTYNLNGTPLLTNTALAGVPTAPTASVGTNTTQLATCAFVLANAGTGFTAGGDLSGTSTSQTVIGIRGTSVPALASGYLHFTGSAFVWDTPAGGGGFTAGGDLSGTSTSQNVIGIRSTSVPVLASGYLHYNGSAFVWDTPSGTGSGISSIVFSTGLSGGTITTSGTVALIVPVAIANGGTGTTTAPTTGQIITAQSASAYGPVTLSGDATITSAGAITVTKTSGTAFTTAATTAIGTSGATIPLLSTANTWTSAQSFPASGIILKGSSTGTTTFTSANASATSYTLTIPANTGTVAELNLAQTWSAVQTFNNGMLSMAGSTSGNTLLEATAAAGSNTIATFPANTGTVAELNLAQTWSAVQTFSSAPVMSGASITSATIPMAALTGTLPIANGGTAATTAPAALTSLGAAPTASPVFTGTPVMPGGNTASGYTGALVLGTVTTPCVVFNTSGFGANGGINFTSGTSGILTLTHGATYDGTNYTARENYAEIIQFTTGNINFYNDSGLTNGSTYTPTLVHSHTTTAFQTAGYISTTLQSGASQIVLGPTGLSNTWGSITANGAGIALIAGGAYATATQWIPTYTAASIYSVNRGTHIWYSNAGLAPPTAFTPTIVGTISSAGLWSLGALAAGAINGTSQVTVYCTSGMNGFLVQQAVGQTSGFVMTMTNASGTSVGNITTSTTATAYGTTSDGRLKTNLVPFLDGRTILDQLPIQSFSWRVNGERGVGVIAQDVKDVYPDAIVDANDEMDMPYMVDFSKYVPLLIQALQDAHRRIDQLEARLNHANN